jgi:hypothetical protein
MTSKHFQTFSFVCAAKPGAGFAVIFSFSELALFLDSLPDWTLFGVCRKPMKT